jgi:hypothetical protein
MKRPIVVLGVYLTDQPSLVESVSAALATSSRWQVEQRWAALGRGAIPGPMKSVTVWSSDTMVPKFTVLNRLLEDIDLDEAAWVVVCDDDVGLPAGFLDAYLALVERYEFALAQPARTPESYIDHPFVERLAGLTARRTRFVEIGPVFSVRQDATRLLLPFDETSQMGWGYDAAWPCRIESAGLRMGIIDATPVTHSFRKPVTHYDFDHATSQMKAYLHGRPQLTASEAFRILESYV